MLNFEKSGGIGIGLIAQGSVDYSAILPVNNTTKSFTLPDGLTWNEVKAAGTRIDLQWITSVHSNADSIYTVAIEAGATFETAKYDTRFMLVIIGADLNTGDFQIQAFGINLTEFWMFGVE